MGPNLFKSLGSNVLAITIASSSPMTLQSLAQIELGKTTDVEVIETRGRLEVHQPLRGLSFKEDSLPAKGAKSIAVTIQIDPSAKYQSMVGFGANLTEAAAVTILKLTPEKRQELMTMLFDKENGAGFDFIRMPMGSCDFSDGSKGSYTYADSPSDLAEKKLRIDRDLKSLDLIKTAKEINPQLKVVVAPWSPPTWMKTNREFNGGTLADDQYENYAAYLVESLEAYARQGFVPDYFSMQNEPRHASGSFPSMILNPDQQIRLIKDHLGPMMKAKNLRPRLLIHDHNWDIKDDVIQVASDPGVRPYIGGIAFHGYGGSVEQISEVTAKFPELPILQTEISSVDLESLPEEEQTYLRKEKAQFVSENQWENFFKSYVTSQLIDGPRVGASSALSWNLVLDNENGPRNGGWRGVQPVVTVNPATGDIRRNIDYVALYHVSHFIQSGAVRIGSNDTKSQGLHNVAFVNPDGTTVVLVFNASSKKTAFKLQRPDGQALEHTLEPGALVTIKWQSPESLLLSSR